MIKNSDDTSILPLIVVGCFCLAISILTFISHDKRLKVLEQSKEVSSIEVRLEQPEFFTCSPKDGLMDALRYYKVPNPEIVWCQAYLETGNFSSNHCVNHNNLFGLYSSKLGRYLSFDHWSTSVETYKEVISNRWNSNENYYEFLERIGYAEDPNYTAKLKAIYKQYFK